VRNNCRNLTKNDKGTAQCITYRGPSHQRQELHRQNFLLHYRHAPPWKELMGATLYTNTGAHLYSRVRSQKPWVCLDSCARDITKHTHNFLHVDVRPTRAQPLLISTRVCFCTCAGGKRLPPHRGQLQTMSCNTKSTTTIRCTVCKAFVEVSDELDSVDTTTNCPQ